MILNKIVELTKKYPNNIVIEENDKSYTYQELYDYSLLIAGKLKNNDINKGDIVTIELARGFRYVATILAVWMRGGAFVALENTYPSDRLDYIAKDSNAKCRINDDFFKNIEKCDPIKIFDYPKEKDISLLIYTSGSTGKPKGVIHTQLSIDDAVNRIASGIKNNDLNHLGQKFLEAVPLSFVAGITIVFFNICYGVIVSFCETQTIKDPFVLSDYINDHKINMAYIPPKVLKIFQQKGHNLHTVITGSEKVSGLYSSDFRILNSYGSSESAGGLTFFEIDKKYDNTPIGKSWGKEVIYVLDDDNNKVTEGEMCLAGNFAVGYLNHEEQTKKTFVPNPFKDEDGFDTLLRTGDLVRLLDDGNILYLNRKDWMIKINGQRVEPGEIEGVIRSIEGIHDVVVKDFTTGSGQTYICAYYVLKDKAKIKEQEIEKILKGKLPSYMVPSNYVKLDKLPVNQNGKLDRSALLEPTVKRNEYVQPKKKEEKELCSLFEEVLEVSKVGLDDDFFSLGGDSIKVMLLISKAKNLSTNLIYDKRTPRNILNSLNNKKDKKTNKKDILKDIVPLTQSQLGIYVSSTDSSKATNNNPTLLKLSKNTNIDKLKEAINKAVCAHPGLFARILVDNDVPSMVYEKSYLDEDIVTLINLKNNEFETYKNELIKPFDIFNERLFRFNIIKTPEELYLFMDIHHIIFDGTSMEILFKDIIDAYNGKEILLEEYNSYQAAYDEYTGRTKNEHLKEREWYLKEFGEVEEISIPEGDKKDSEISYAEKRVELNVELGKVIDFCNKNKISENILLCSAFGKLLSSYTMNKHTSFSTIYNGRHDFKTSHTIGMMVRPLPVLCSNDTSLSIVKYLELMKEQMMGAMVNDAYSYFDLAKETGYTPDLLFTYQGHLFELFNNDTIETELIPFEYNQTGEKMAIQVYVIGDKLIFNIQYYNNLYSNEFIDEFIKRFEVTLNKFLTKKYLKDVDIVTKEEVENIIKVSYGGLLEYDRNKTFIDLFLSMVKKYPNKVVVKDEESSYTYKELDLASNKIANYLIDKGIKERDFVAIKVRRIKEFISSLIGIQKAGAAYIPIDPTYPDERIEYMIEDSKTKIVLEEKLIKDIVESGNNQEINLSRPDIPAYMIYTSGSTGKPKGVVILHKSLVNAIEWRIRDYKLSSKSVNASHASFSFDASIDDIFPPLSVGGEVVILDEVTRKDLDLIYEHFTKNGINGVTMSTQIGMSLINAHPDLKLNYMVMGGEKLLPTKETSIRLINGYGPTEFTVCSSFHEVKKGEDNIPIGKAVANTYSLICDPQGNLLPLGMVGELCLAGIQISEGYFGREELNKERFILCPYINELMYKTGDLARYNEDGELEYIGRIDFQVKLRGFRIELGEIENKAASFPDVLLTSAQVKNNLLCLYYTATTKIDDVEFKEYLASSLTDYMVPTLYMQLDEMPLTPNGKINRKALPDIKRDNEKLVKPENKIEKELFNLLATILKFDEFGVTDDFGYIGLTSLSSMQFVSHISSTFNKSIRVSDLIKYNNIRLLAHYLDNKVDETNYEIFKEYPLTQAQMGILSEVLAHPDSTIYNIPTVIGLPDKIDLDKLKEALINTINAHPYLKSKLVCENGNDFKVIRDDNLEIKINIIDYYNELERLVVPFDLLNDQLIRISILKTKKGNKLLIDAHHIIFDGESLDIFLRDLAKAYSGEELSKEAYSEYEFSLDEIKRLNSSELEEAHKFYNKLLESRDLDCLLVADHSEKNIGKREYNLDFKIDNKLVNKFIDKNKLTINSLWISSLGLTLARYLNRNDAYFTTVYNGRSDSKIHNSIGMFVHTLPLIVEPFKDNNSVDYIKNVGKLLSESMANDIYSFKDLAHDYSLRADIMFVYEGTIAQGFNIGGEEVNDIYSLALDELKAPILFMVALDKDGYKLHIEYDGNKYSEWSISSFIDSVLIAFEKLINNDNPNDISLLNDKRKKELISFNHTDREFEHVDLITLFRRRAKEYPNNLAVKYKDKSLTYKEVDELTDRIAKYMMDKGITSNDVVSILLSRNEYMVIAPLSAMKTGAAYQPLDSSYPTERLEFMINDAGAKFLIAEKGLLDKIPNINIPTLLIEDIDKLKDIKVTKADLVHPDFNDLMIMLYTSGTTGTPKGVMLLQRNLVNFVNWYHNYYDLKSDSVVAAYAGFGFDACMMDLYPALTKGACVCIVPEDIRLNMDKLEEYFEHNGVTHSFMTTQVGRLFAESKPNSIIHHLSVGGEKLVPLNIPNTFKMHNGYGPTECTIFSTIKLVDKDYMRIPIGKALDNYKLYVVDEQLHELPIGALGELLISGMGVGNGYLNQPEKTASTFIDNPFDDGYKKVYRTGDVVRRLDDGSIDFIGRNDGQVKIRGFRIELNEVELIIRSFPGIKDVTVQAYDSKSGQGKFLAAYFVSDKKIDVNLIKEHIKKEKPAYMVPSSIMQIESIPLNQNQKVNKKALPEPNVTIDDKEFIEPTNELEKEICTLYQNILGLDKVSAADSFFDIGGSSIDAAKIVVYMMNHQYPVAYQDIFTYPSPIELAKYIQDNNHETSHEETNIKEEREALKYNTIQYVDDIKLERELGTVLLTGSTGFLGIHILKELLMSKIKVYVLIKARNVKPLDRLKGLLMYYFDSSFDEEIKEQLTVISGDITDDNLNDIVKDYHIDTIINSAAIVKHFASDDSIERVNVYGVKNLIKIALEKKARLVQVSTLSVAGENVNHKFPENYLMKENQLYFGQDLSNKYVSSKFHAEEAILDAVEEGLDAKIVRVGNLMARQSDGEFQINNITNSFIRSLRSYKVLGKFPISMLDRKVDFSPIDETAKTIILLAQAPKKFTVFHSFNSHQVEMGDVIEALNLAGIKIDKVNDIEFSKIMQEYMLDEKKSVLVSSLVSYSTSDNLDHELIQSDEAFSIKALYRLGYKWPITDFEYLKKAIVSLITLGFFEREDM